MYISLPSWNIGSRDKPATLVLTVSLHMSNSLLLTHLNTLLFPFALRIITGNNDLSH